jgi:hypothetical protein
VILAERKSVANIPESLEQTFVEPRIRRLTDDGFDVPDGSDLIDKPDASGKSLELRSRACVNVKNAQIVRHTSRQSVIETTNVDWRFSQTRIPPCFPKRRNLGPPTWIDGAQLPSTNFDFPVVPCPDSICETVNVRGMTQP